MKKYSKDLVLFLLINFGVLAVGGWLMGEGPSSVFYQNLNKAPWTPPGWVFGAAWTTIMICFSVYMAYWKNSENTLAMWSLFALQVILNISWNPLFFKFYLPLISLIFIVLLTILVGYIYLRNTKKLGLKNWFIAPYLIWLIIATSLNAYIFLNN